ncbi:MAG: TIGR03086 family metal-binding protein [Acidimicrobiales bacterium]
MTDPIADYETAADGFARVLGQCPGSLDQPSPCEGWKAKDVVDHVLGGTAHFTTGFGGTQPPDSDDDLAARYAALREAFVSACRAPGALEQMVPSPIGGELPATVMLGIFTTDTLIHTWDLARAIGVDVSLDEDLLQRSWDGMIPIESVVRRPGIFGPAVDVPDDAPFQDRAIAFFGRTP